VTKRERMPMAATAVGLESAMSRRPSRRCELGRQLERSKKWSSSLTTVAAPNGDMGLKNKDSRWR
jgi:hypothetical protein